MDWQPMRLLYLAVICLLVGCDAVSTAPAPLTPEQREAIKQSLLKLGAKVTADIPEGLYLSLRNTHVQIRETGGAVEGSRRSRADIIDFCSVNETIAMAFLDANESGQFKQWLRGSLLPKARSVPQAEYTDFTITLNRVPLRAIFSRKPAATEGQ
jgi:hypothetical protein